VWAIASAPSDGSPPAHIHGNYAAGACGTHVVAWEVINVTAVHQQRDVASLICLTQRWEVSLQGHRCPHVAPEDTLPVDNLSVRRDIGRDAIVGQPQVFDTRVLPEYLL
jgi:hypothetical protein